MLIECFMPTGSLNGTQELCNKPGASRREDCGNYFRGMLEGASAKYKVEKKEDMQGSMTAWKSGMDENESFISQDAVSPEEKAKEYKKRPGDIETLLFYYLEAVSGVVHEMANEDAIPSGPLAVNGSGNNLAQDILKELYGNYQVLQTAGDILTNGADGANGLESVMNLPGIDGDNSSPVLSFSGFTGNEEAGWHKEVKQKLEELLQKFNLPSGSIVLEQQETGNHGKTVSSDNQAEFLNITVNEHVDGNAADTVEGLKSGHGDSGNNAVDSGDDILDLKKEGLAKEYAGKSAGHAEHENSHEARDIAAGPEFSEKLKNNADETMDNSKLLYVNYSPGNGEEQKNILSVQEDALPAEVFRNEIIFSITNKAKTLVTDKQSEIVVNLKPDSLGKVTLRVVTESNFVAAKIFTENYQVKEIIESNFQMLKDALEKQGLIIHDLSVSVKDGGSEGSLYSRQDNGNVFQGVKGGRIVKDASLDNYQLESRGYAAMVFLYDRPYSTINLKA